MKNLKPNIKASDNSIAIVGWHEGLAGQIHAWLERYTNYRVACFINPADVPPQITKIQRDATQFSYPTESSFKDRPLVNSSNWFKILKELGINKVLVTTDNMKERYEQINQARENGLQLINAIHPTAIIMEDAIIYDNVILDAKVFVGYRAEVFSGVVMHTGAQIDHHCVLRECATIDPGVVFASNVTVGKFTRVHTGAVCKNRIKIGENSIIGAGSVIIENVPDNVTVVGVPGKIIKHHKQNL